MVSFRTAQHFWLLGTGNGTFDAADKSQLNTVNPVNRDTATVPPYGWVAFRFLVRPWLCSIAMLAPVLHSFPASTTRHCDSAWYLCTAIDPSGFGPVSK
jgi:Multicopper oxidase